MVKNIRSLLLQSATISTEKHTRFFKTKPGDYAHHDRFLGVSVPTLRKIAKTLSDIDQLTLNDLIQSPFNEERLLALFILISRYPKEPKACYDLYLSNLQYINNWNLVDASAHLIIGNYLFDKDRSLLITLARSNNMWERRIAIISTWYFIRKLDLDFTFKLAEILLKDNHDLMHKATGWMLREAGKKDEASLINFLNLHSKKIPRTMLRYSIEKLTREQRDYYLTLRNSPKKLL